MDAVCEDCEEEWDGWNALNAAMAHQKVSNHTISYSGQGRNRVVLEPPTTSIANIWTHPLGSLMIEGSESRLMPRLDKVKRRYVKGYLDDDELEFYTEKALQNEAVVR